MKNKCSAYILALLMILTVGFTTIYAGDETPETTKTTETPETPATPVPPVTEVAPQEQKSWLELSAVPVTVNLEVADPVNPSDQNLVRQISAFKGVVKEINIKNNESVTAPFSVQSRQHISQKLLDAAQLEPDDCFKKYLTELAANIANNSIFSSRLSHWLDLSNNRAELFFEKDDRLMAFFFALNECVAFIPNGYTDSQDTFISPVIYLNRPDDTETYAAYSAIFSKMQDNLPVTQTLVTAYSPLVPSFKIGDIISSQSRDDSVMIYPDITERLRNHDAGEEAPGKFKILLFRNRIEAYFYNVLMPIAAEILEDRLFNQMDVDTYLSNIVMNRMAHHLGPVFTISSDDNTELEANVAQANFQTQRRKPKKQQKVTSKLILKTIPEHLLDVFQRVESLKSQSLALHNTSVLIENGLLAEDKELAVYSVHVVSLLDHIRQMPNSVFAGQGGYFMYLNLPVYMPGAKGAATTAAIFQLNYFLNREAILFNINNGRIDIDPIKFKAAAKELASMILNYCAPGMYASVRSVFYEYLQLVPKAVEILKRIQDIPVLIEYNN